MYRAVGGCWVCLLMHLFSLFLHFSLLFLSQYSVVLYARACSCILTPMMLVMSTRVHFII